MTANLDRSLDELLIVLSRGATIVAAFLTVWLVASVAAEVVAGLRGRRGRVLTRISAPGARRLASGLLGVSMLLAACGTENSAPELHVVGPADGATSSTTISSTTAPSTTVSSTANSSTTVPPTSSVPSTTVDTPPTTVEPSQEPSEPSSTPSSPPSDPARPSAVGPSTPSTHRVEAGDSLWSIARAEVEAATDGPVSEAEVARYWAALVDSTRSSLRSGSPDLIHPGEVLELPAIA